jgi:hypothetical protein
MGLGEGGVTGVRADILSGRLHQGLLFNAA